MAHIRRYFSPLYHSNGRATQPAPQALPQVAGVWDAPQGQHAATEDELEAGSRGVERPTEENAYATASSSEKPRQNNFVSGLYGLVNRQTNGEVIRYAEDGGTVRDGPTGFAGGYRREWMNIGTQPLSTNKYWRTSYSNGNGFVSLNREKFSKDIIDVVFKHKNMESFIRHLNVYDLRKSNRAGRRNGKNDTCFFQHQDGLLMRNRPSPLHRIKRKGPDNGVAPYLGSNNGRAMPHTANGLHSYNSNGPARLSQNELNKHRDKYDNVSTQLKRIQVGGDEAASSVSSYSTRHQSQLIERTTAFHLDARTKEIEESSFSRAQSFDSLVTNGADSHDGSGPARPNATRLLIVRLSEAISPQDNALVHYLDGNRIVRESHIPFNTSGAFCDVFIGSHPIYDKVALKRPRLTMDGSEGASVKHFLAEAQIWSNLRHPNILRFIGVIEAGHYIWLISPFAANGSLPDYIKAHPETDREKLVLQLVDAVEYLHRRKVIHGDIKGANILISENVDVLLCDFGLAKYQDMRTATSLKGAGTYCWSAPELLFEDDASKTTASDVYAFGMTVYQILSGHRPFEGYSYPRLARAINSNKRPPKKPVTSLSGSSYVVLWEVAEACWVRKASERPTMSTVQARLSLKPVNSFDMASSAPS